MRWIYSFLILVISFLLIADGVQAQSGAARGRGRIRGIVTDTQGNPLESVLVRFTSNRLQTSFELRTNNKGEWVAAGIAGGQWNIDFIKDGFMQKNISTSVSTVVYNKPIELSLEKTDAGQPKVKGSELVQEGNKLRTHKTMAALF